MSLDFLSITITNFKYFFLLFHFFFSDFFPSTLSHFFQLILTGFAFDPSFEHPFTLFDFFLHNLIFFYFFEVTIGFSPLLSPLALIQINHRINIPNASFPGRKLSAQESEFRVR